MAKHGTGASGAHEFPGAEDAALDEIARGCWHWASVDGATGVGTQTREVIGAVVADAEAPGIAARMRAGAADLHARTGWTTGFWMRLTTKIRLRATASPCTHSGMRPLPSPLPTAPAAIPVRPWRVGAEALPVPR
ncbi:hypothetical protein [Actinomyces sp.]|uniref:hypothetical protein n=1 Tax=Actinomyces sp. TaxID=29317 RepID=UPI0026DC5A77|nr:hypothetical protein [Actinomyces sp.]MDO4899615.1 hypothetical protein [Actinomyces sp.]